jgi:hypothetical protein
MSKIFIEKMQEFVKAGYELSKMWDGLTEDQADAITLKSYPFTEDFQKVVADLGEWAQEAIEELQKLDDLEKKFEGETYCMALADNGVTEDGWFLSVRLKNRTLYLEEEIAGHIHHIDIREFEGNFIQVDKSLYELAVKLNMYGDYEAVCDLQKLAQSLHDRKINLKEYE